MNIFFKIAFKLFYRKILIVDIDKESGYFYYSVIAIFKNNFEILLNDIAKINHKASLKKNIINLFFQVENLNKFKVQGVYFISRAENTKVYKFVYNDFAKNNLKQKDLYKFMLHSIPKNTIPIQSYQCFNYLNKNQQGFKDFSLNVDTVVKDKRYVMEIKKACDFCDINLLGLMSDLFIVGMNKMAHKKKNQNLLVINISRFSSSCAIFNGNRIKEVLVQKKIGYATIIEDMAKEFNFEETLSEDIFTMVVKNSFRGGKNSSVLKIVDYLGNRELELERLQQFLLNSFNQLSKKIVEFCSHNINIKSLDKIVYIVPEKYDLGYKDKLKEELHLPVASVKLSCKNAYGVLYSFNSALVANALQYIILRKGKDVAMKDMKI